MGYKMTDHVIYVLWLVYTYVRIVSLSTVVLISRDRYENVWFPKNMCLEKQPFKNHNAKNQLQLYLYNTNNATTSFKSSQMLLTWPDSEF